MVYSFPDASDDENNDQAVDYEEAVLEGDFTWRAVIVGLGVGVILCMTNIYFGLQSGVFRSGLARLPCGGARPAAVLLSDLPQDGFP